MSQGFSFTVVPSSRMMSDITGIRHDNVVRAIKQLTSTGAINQPTVEERKAVSGQKGYDHIFYGERGQHDAIAVMSRMAPQYVGKLRVMLGIDEVTDEEFEALLLPKTSPAIVPQAAKPISKLLDDAVSMTSQEIADLLGSQHSHLKISIERLMDRGVIQDVALRQLRSDSGQLAKVYVFSGTQGKRDSIIVVAQNSPEFTAALVDRWQELEAQVAKPPALVLPNFSNPAEAARAWATEFEGRTLALEHIQVLDAKIAEDSSKVEFYEEVAVAEGCQTIKAVADELDVGRNSLYKYLRKHKVLIERGKDHNLPYQVQKDAGRFTVVLEPYPHPHTGKTEFGSLTMVTGKGLIFIRELIAKHGRAGLTKD